MSPDACGRFHRKGKQHKCVLSQSGMELCKVVLSTPGLCAAFLPPLHPALGEKRHRMLGLHSTRRLTSSACYSERFPPGDGSDPGFRSTVCREPQYSPAPLFPVLLGCFFSLPTLACGI